MKQLNITPPSSNVADLLEVITNPDKARKHLSEIQGMHRELQAALGLFRDDTNILSKAIKYLTASRERKAVN